jgi:hypothetical protein
MGYLISHAFPRCLTYRFATTSVCYIPLSVTSRVRAS